LLHVAIILKIQVDSSHFSVLALWPAQ